MLLVIGCGVHVSRAGREEKKRNRVRDREAIPDVRIFFLTALSFLGYYTAQRVSVFENFLLVNATYGSGVTIVWQLSGDSYVRNVDICHCFKCPKKNRF